MLFDGGGAFFARQLGGAAVAAGGADVVHRAGGAVGFAAAANGGAQVHQPLGVGGHIGGGWRQQLFGVPPQLALEGFVGRVAVEGEQAAQHAFDVAVEYGFAAAEGEGGNGGGGAAADAGEFFQFAAFGGETAAKVAADLRRGFVQVAGAAVVTQSGPQPQHFVFGRGGQAGDIGKGAAESRVVVEHGGDLGLLQHDFRQPHAVGVGALPGQAVAAVAALPADQARGELAADGVGIGCGKAA